MGGRGWRSDYRGTYTLGKEKDLVYPITLPSQRYSVYFKIQDKSTGLTTISSLSLQLSTLFSQGWLVLGEGDDGRAQLDMVSRVERTRLC